jgi:hypothetical protein
VVAVLDSLLLAAHLDTQHVKPHVFVTKVHAQVGHYGQHVQEIAELELEHVILDPLVQLLKQSHAAHGIAQQA